ncbi:MAG: hypothetical protein IJ518_03390 [Clostridia bacterium]|nr:hypothetical protein [Clostridia bacterium]
MKVYAHYVHPERYPRFTKRPLRVLSRDVLGNRVRFSASRFITVERDSRELVCVENELDRYTVQHQIGECFWLNWQNFLAENAHEMVEAIRDRGLYLYGAWGYEPGAEADIAANRWGEFSVEEAFHRQLTEELGDRFFGYEMGEQDGRYIGAYVSREDRTVHPKSRVEQCKNFERWHERIAADAHYRMTVLCSSTLVHYYARGGYATLLSCEAGQALPNPQMWYAFMRGASKQYGLLTAGNVSVWNRWGYKTYGEPYISDVGDEGGPEHGTSLSLMRRILWNEYMYNCDILGFENSWFTNDDSERHVGGDVTPAMAAQPGVLSPVGEVQQYAARRIGELGYPGVMYTPVAVMLDAFAGWIPPRFLYTPKLYEVWGSMPYAAGDHQTHALFSMLYPGYENAGFYEDETGFLTATPYGEPVDVLLSDAPRAVMAQYPLLLVMNGTRLDTELWDKLTGFVRAGGHLTVCASVVLEQTTAPDVLGFFGLQAAGGYTAVTGTAAYAGREYPVSGLGVLSATLPPEAVVEATVEGCPAIITLSHGQGRVTVLLTDTGLEAQAVSGPLENKPNAPVPVLQDFSPFIKAWLGDRLTAYTIVKPTDPALQYIVTVRSAGEVLLQVVNNTPVTRRYALTAPGGIARVEPLPLTDDVAGVVGYHKASAGVCPEQVVGEGPYAIAPGDVQLYALTLEEALELQPESIPEVPPRRLGAKLPYGCISIRDFLQETPTFTQYFDTVLVDGGYLERTDPYAVEQEAVYLRRQGVRVAVDVCRLLNGFPDWHFDPAFPRRREESFARLDRLLDKACLYDLEAVILSAPADESVFAHVRSRVPASTVVICRNSGLCQPMDALYRAAEATPGVELGYCTSAGLSHRHPSPHTPEAVGETHPLRHLFLSAPTVTAAGNRQNGQRPVFGSGFEQAVKGAMDAVCGGYLYLSADYTDWDEIYRDYRWLIAP